MNDIYQQGLVALAKQAVGDGTLPNPDIRVRKDNRLCGDRIDLELVLDGDRVAALAHRVRGCLLCRAAASAIGRSAPGQSRRDIEAAYRSLQAMLAAESIPEPWPPSGWESLNLFEPVRDHKSRHTCVLLPFEALREALVEALGSR